MLGCNSWSPCTWEQLRPGQQSGQYWVPQREYWVPHWPPPRWRLWPSDKQRRSSASKVIPLTTLTTLESARSTSSYKLWSSLLSDRVLTQVPRLTLLLRLNTRLTSHVNTDCPAARFSDQTQLQSLMKNGWMWRPYSTALLLTFRLFTKCIRHWNFCELRMYSSYYVR